MQVYKVLIKREFCSVHPSHTHTFACNLHFDFNWLIAWAQRNYCVPNFETHSLFFFCPAPFTKKKMLHVKHINLFNINFDGARQIRHRLKFHFQARPAFNYRGWEWEARVEKSFFNSSMYFPASANWKTLQTTRTALKRTWNVWSFFLVCFMRI